MFVGRIQLKTDQIQFGEKDSSLTITLFGIKNDYDRDGFQVTPDLQDVFLNAALALRIYIQRTSGMSSPAGGPVFLSLRPPYHAVSASTVARVLEEVHRVVRAIWARIYGKIVSADGHYTGSEIL